MNIPQQICKVSDRLIEPNNFFVFFSIAVFCLFLFIINRILKKQKKTLYKIIFSLSTSLVIFLLWAVLSIILLVFLGGDDNPPSYNYHPLNAMVKLRCYKEQGAPFCPKTAKDIYKIVPDYLKDSLSHAQVTYAWYPKTQEYTLIVRNDNYQHNNYRAVIFDPRLIQAKNYGLHGLDFFDADIINNCDGTYKITNPPPFSGPWNKIN